MMNRAPERGRSGLRMLLPLLLGGAVTALLLGGNELVGAQARRVEGLSRAQLLAEGRERALAEVFAAARSEAPELRANAMEAVQYAPQHAGTQLRLGLEDEHPAVRFTALVAIGKLEISELALAVQRARLDPVDYVQAAAQFAAHRLGGPSDPTILARLLASEDPGRRSNAAMLTGLMGEKTAVPMLREMVRMPMRRASAVRQALYRVQVSEALVQLGEESAIDGIRAGAYSPFDEVRILSVQILGRLEDHRMVPALAKLLQTNPIELRLASAEALLQVGHPGPARIAIEESRSSQATIRAQAAHVLGFARDQPSAAALLHLIEDPEPQVRLTAAAALLRTR